MRFLQVHRINLP
eukprot:gene9991-biopygen2547